MKCNIQGNWYKFPFRKSIKEQTCGCQGGGRVGEKWIGGLGLADVSYYI